MGLGPVSLKFFKYIDLELGSALIFGKQNLYLSKSQSLKLFGKDYSKDEMADELVKNEFNTSDLHSLDYSAYQGADFIHDLNVPVPKEMHGSFDSVLNIGTLEHVFDIKTAVTNMIDLCRVDGHVVFIGPSNNDCGHGFYQFSPEFLLQIFNKNNGFSDVQVYVSTHAGLKSKLYSVERPLDGQRIQIRGSEAVQVYCVAKKISCSVICAQQSDYSYLWEHSDEELKYNKGMRSVFKKILKKQISDKTLSGVLLIKLSNFRTRILRSLRFHPLLKRIY